MKFQRIFLVVADSAGIGAMPDADKWGDAGSDTIGNTIRSTGVYLPNLHQLGLGNITTLPGHPPLPQCSGCFGKAAIASQGKDTTVGHWEMAGILTETPFPTYPRGFPAEIMAEFERRTGLGWLGNYPASGTEIIKDLGAEHMQTGRPIVYTSADSVFQIAAHEAIIPLEQLYQICLAAREILQGPHRVARVIARPFIGAPGDFTRTSNRKDFAVPPPEPNLLSQMDEAGIQIVSIGKIASIFEWRHSGKEIHTHGNTEGIATTMEQIKSSGGQFFFVNLVDFDMLYGHRNDAPGYARALLELDLALPQWMAAMRDSDCLIITADHGCDPTTISTDHSREYVPIICWSRKDRGNVNLGTRASLADIGQTIAANFALRLAHGESFLGDLL